MKESGNSIVLVDKVYIRKEMAIDMKDNSNVGFTTEKERWNMQMEINMKEIGLKEKKVEWACTHGQTVITTMDSGIRIALMVKEQQCLDQIILMGNFKTE
jgi:hypothetical protein